MRDKASEELLTAEIEGVKDSAAILRLRGEVDISSSHVLAASLNKVAGEGYATVLIDATEVTFMDSTGLHTLIEGKRVIHESGSRILLVPSLQVRRVLELVFPDPLYADRMTSLEDALAVLEED